MVVNQKRWLRTAAASLASYVFFSAALHRLHLLDAPPPSRPRAPRAPRPRLSGGALASALAQCAEPQRCRPLWRRDGALARALAPMLGGADAAALPRWRESHSPDRAPLRRAEAAAAAAAGTDRRGRRLHEAYGDMLRGVSRMAARNAMGAHFFYVSLHRATAEAACAFGDRVAYLAPSPEATKKDAAADAGTAGSIRRRPGRSTRTPHTINIGLYHVRSDVEPRNFDFFATMLSYARRHPLVFDQGLLNCVLKRMSSSKRLTFIRERDNCRSTSSTSTTPRSSD
ncbi:hypothetical protein JL720_16429 [Aureococcus anophagefferens]|nr:hypothetical protein JL720_16429 [Aureococcus anophagefferens]